MITEGIYTVQITNPDPEAKRRFEVFHALLSSPTAKAIGISVSSIGWIDNFEAKDIPPVVLSLKIPGV